MQRPGGGIGYTLQLITYKDSPIKSVADLKGKRVAHVAPSSNSGDIAPRALFGAMGVVPGKDYEVLYSGKHDNSVMGVVNKDYDAAPVASTVVERMQARGMFKPDALRVVYESSPFPRTAFGVAHNLAPELKAKIREAFLSFDFKKSKLATEFKDTERFAAISYKEAWRDVRTIQKASGVHRTRRKACPSSAPRPSSAVPAVAAGSPAHGGAPRAAAGDRGADQGLPGRHPGAGRRQLHRRSPRGHRHHRLLGRRQEHADPLHQPAGRTDVRAHPPGRHRHRRPAAARTARRSGGASA